MHFTQTTLATLAFAFFGSTSAHMVMQKPAPYSGKSLPQTSPLDGSTYAFPCQGGTDASYYEGTTATSMKVGTDQTLEFQGQAVHGGGSCQLSVTYEDPPPADQSKWKVIETMIGGCPALTAGNLEDTSINPNASQTDANGYPVGNQCGDSTSKDCVRSYTFQIPDKLKNGKATLAWTWFNKIGNREMYMNCAPISISGGSDDDTYYDSLPDLFVANIPGKCTTGNGVLGFPNPGTNVVHGGDPAVSAAMGTCDSGLNGAAGAGSASGAVSSDAAATSTAAASYAAASTPAATASSAAGAAYTPVASYAAANTPVVVATPTYAAASAAGTGSASGSVTCDTDGAVICIGSSQFGLCNRGYAVPQALADGTTCSNGSITKRDGGVVVGHRNMRHGRPHARAIHAGSF